MKKSVTLFTILLDYVLWLQQSIFIDAFDIYDQAFLAITPLILIRHVRNERELERKCVPQFFLGSLPWERAGQLLAIFSLSSDNPRSLCAGK